jgi:hypothetical protein
MISRETAIMLLKDGIEPKKSKTPVTLIIILLCVAGAIMWGLTMAGCSWQGQKHIERDPVTQNITLDNEWWSMRFCWISSGVEAYTKTPYYESGALVRQSKSEPNSVNTLAVGAAGLAGGL